MMNQTWQGSKAPAAVQCMTAPGIEPGKAPRHQPHSNAINAKPSKSTTIKENSNDSNRAVPKRQLQWPTNVRTVPKRQLQWSKNVRAVPKRQLQSQFTVVHCTKIYREGLHTLTHRVYIFLSCVGSGVGVGVGALALQRPSPGFFGVVHIYASHAPQHPDAPYSGD